MPRTVYTPGVYNPNNSYLLSIEFSVSDPLARREREDDGLYTIYLPGTYSKLVLLNDGRITDGYKIDGYNYNWKILPKTIVRKFNISPFALEDARGLFTSKGTILDPNNYTVIGKYDPWEEFNWEDEYVANDMYSHGWLLHPVRGPRSRYEFVPGQTEAMSEIARSINKDNKTPIKSTKSTPIKRKSSPATSKTIPKTKPSYAGLFSGAARSFTFRKNWVNTHKDYLGSHGSNIDWNNYRGTAKQNITLKKLMDNYKSNNPTPKTVEKEAPKQEAVLEVVTPPPHAAVEPIVAVVPVVLETDAPIKPEDYYKMHPYSEEARRRYQEYVNNRQL